MIEAQSALKSVLILDLVKTERTNHHQHQQIT